eukprot:gene16041-4859_t
MNLEERVSFEDAIEMGSLCNEINSVGTVNSLLTKWALYETFQSSVDQTTGVTMLDKVACLKAGIDAVAKSRIRAAFKEMLKTHKVDDVADDIKRN